MTWHDVKQVFNSVLSLKAKIAESYPNEVADDLSFQVGYYHGRGSNKRWLLEDRDVSEMYKNIDKKSVTLWCEGRPISIDESEPPPKKQRTKRDLVEDEVDDIMKTLKEKHVDMAIPKLRLWARLIHSGHHDDYDAPPNIPLITGSPNPTKGKKESISTMSDAFTGAANAIASALKHTRTPETPTSSSTVSPMKTAQLRRSCLEDLKRIKELFEDHVLSEEEFAEQKKNILSSLKSL